ncbi:hypothetical protein V8G54_034671 [Vigna mungo]|uniref:Kinesin motor domain-containing protein n=1 Tax=Vigna mungo TaxID=3915 RepID=A0AAQ3RDQ2_VIGMU
MEKIHVSVRAKPLSQDDEKTSPWRISGNSIAISNLSNFDFAEVYEARTKDIVEAAVRGFNGTVFAYGQTNSGKTYTMRGSKAEPGVIPLAVNDLFQIIQQFFIHTYRSKKSTYVHKACLDTIQARRAFGASVFRANS